MQELSHLPNDIVERIRKAYFKAYVKPTMARVWFPVHGCRIDFRRPLENDFVSQAVNWVSAYVYSFFPRGVDMESKSVRGPYFEYLETHKYCWVGVVDIEVEIGSAVESSIKEDIKFGFQQEFNCLEVSGRTMRLNLRSQLRSMVAWSLSYCDIDPDLFEWKRLVLKIDAVKEVVYFEDPSDGRKSKRVYSRDQHPLVENNHIPWLVFLP